MDSFEKLISINLDHFQIQAIEYLKRDNSVVVCAPTGSGKSIVGFWACYQGISQNLRCFYTTPIKALSNQKHQELYELFQQPIGLLTGDHSINPDANVVVMTTEVLRNMIYASSESLNGLKYVVLDELHFIQDPYRGGIWEEIILQSPKDVIFICLSATATNAEQLASWIEFVHGKARSVTVSHRPVPLENLLAIKLKNQQEVEFVKVLNGKNPSKQILKIKNVISSRNPYLRAIYKNPSIYEVVDSLKEHLMLPAIWFVFSRQACDRLAKSFLTEGYSLINSEQSTELIEIADSLASKLDEEELNALDYGTFLAILSHGVAPHHAGMPVVFKEIVEKLFSLSLIKLVIATETLATGINMPAKTVVIEKLSKRDESGHRSLKPWEFTQMTGRAGRRSIDTKGYAVVPFNRWLSIRDLVLYCQKTNFEVKSAFRPTYNTVANLAKRMSEKQAFELMANSLASFQSKRPFSKELRKVIEILNNHGLLKGFELTQSGWRLTAIYHELDLVIVDALEEQLFNQLTPDQILGALAALCFEERGGKRAKKKWVMQETQPIGELQEVLDRLFEINQKIRHEEKALGVSNTREISLGFVQIALMWFNGASLGDILKTGISPGDFVRSIRQIIDLSRSLSNLDLSDELKERFQVISRSLDKGIVASSKL